MTDENTKGGIVKGTAKRSVLALTPGARALGRGVRINVGDVPESGADQDLIGDSFHMYWSHSGAEFKGDERIPEGRKINARLLKWFSGIEGFQDSRQKAAGCIPAAAGAAVGAYHFLSSDESIRQALAEQDQAAAAEEERAHCERMAQALEEAGDAEGAAEYAQRAENAEEAREQAMAAAAQAIEGLEESDIHKAMAQAAIKEAAEEAENIKETMKGWGLSGGDPQFRDAEEASRFMEMFNEEIARVAKIAGRVRGISSRARAIETKAGVIPTNMTLSKDPRRIVPSERLKMSDASPEQIRQKTRAQYVQNGLLSIEQSGEGEEEGPFVILADRSGSMAGMEFAIAKGVSLGLCQTAKKEDRRFVAGTFAGAGAPIVSVSSDDDFESILRWASQTAGGGTDFNWALKWALDQLEEMGGDAGADLVFITDGRAKINDDILRRWNEYTAETGARLFYVPTSGSGFAYDERIEAIADETIVMGELDGTAADDMAKQIGGWM